MSSHPPQLPGSSEPPHPRYKLALYGGGTEEVDRFELRDRIRKGEVDDRTQIAAAGSDDWLLSTAFPELKRYLELAAQSRKVVALKQPARRAVSTDVTSMREEMIEALALPVKGYGILTILAIATFLAIPFIGLISVPIMTVYVVAIVRHSANGNRELPTFVETSDVVGNLIVWLKTWFVSIIALWPVVVWLLIWASGTDRLSSTSITTLLVGLCISGFVSMLYFPACLATIAVWDSVLDSLNPVYVFAVIKRIGTDYILVVAAYLAVTAVAVAMSVMIDSSLRMLPVIGSIPGKIPVIWAQFYTAHLLGWAVYRHADDLGWD